MNASGPVSAIGPDGKPIAIQPGSPAAGGPTPSASTPGASPGATAQKQADAKGEASAEEGKKGETKQSGPVKRPDKPPKIADPRELQVVPDEQNRVQFSFHGQPWPEVLQWLANVSNYSLDWQELPGGYLNLTTQRSYSLPEARDLIHSRLRDRGYTMLLNGEILSIAKIDKVDPSLVPRVSEEELYDLQPFDMVKLSFELPPGMDAAATAEDIKKVLSPHAKVLPLPATKRILVIDAVGNLRGVSSLLNEERLAVEGRIVPTEIVVKHRRAEKLIDILYVILGLDPVSQPSQMELQVEQQKMQLIQQMAGSGKDVSKMLKEDKPSVHIAYNSQRNSLLINALPEELKIIERTVKLLDVPTDGELPPDATAGPQIRVARSYKLKSIDPKSLQTTLEEIGDLDPLTELRADNRASILFARATPADHEKIEKLKQQLDSDTMQTLVIELRKHPADAVAGTLRDLFVPKKESDSSSDHQRYNPYGSFYGMTIQEPKKKIAGDLRVDADVENNCLFVRGNAEALQQVLEFLEKIGETPQGKQQGTRVRVLEPLEPAAMERLLKELRSSWSVMNESELIIRGPEFEVPTAEKPATDTRKVPTDRSAGSPAPHRFRFAADGTAADLSHPSTSHTTTEADGRVKPEVVVTIAPDGRLVLSSDDSEALDRLENHIEASRPPQRRFEVYKVNYVRVSSIYLILTGLYKEELKGETPQRSWDWRTDSWVTVGGDKSAQLSKRKTLKLDYDFNSNTLLVANATAQQQQEIEELIREYDKPSGDEAKSRRVAAIKVKYSRAKVVAAALKEVYRDLLSQRDKEFEKDEKTGATSPKESTTILRFGGPGEEPSDGDRQRPAEIGFQGALSVGVDEISNTIIISAQEDVFDSVVSIIKVLDEEARPDVAVEVRKINGGLSPDALRTALGEALGTPWVGGRPELLLGQGDNGNQQHGPSQGPQTGQPAPQPGVQPGGPRPAAQGD